MKRVLVVLISIFVCAVGQGNARGNPRCLPTAMTACVTVQSEADAVLSVGVDDDWDSGAAAAVASLTITIDDQPEQELLLFPGTGRREYDAVIGPLAAGSHKVGLGRSTFWPAPAPRVHDLRLRVVSPADRDFEEVRYAPALWARADTIGTASDAILRIYVERSKAPDDSTTLTYTTIFSTEDGGTSTPALMARWGRTTDIEWTYAVRLADGRVMDERYQAADHGTRRFDGGRVGSHPLILVATLNNVFAARGRTAVLVRPVPRSVDLRDATRESVMDPEPWMYRVMARELLAERKVRGAAGAAREPALIDDPRAYVYVEARIALQNTAAAASLLDGEGTWHFSHGGIADLAVTRDGDVRVAIPAGTGPTTAVGWECLPQASALVAKEAGCGVRLLKAFTLDRDYQITPLRVVPLEFHLRPGEMRTLSVQH